MLPRIILLFLFLWNIMLTQGQAGQDEREPLFSSGVELGVVSPEQIDNLQKLCKVWGFLKYKHPKITEGEIDWDQALFSYIRLIPEADFDKKLYEMLPPLEQKIERNEAPEAFEWIKDEKRFLPEIRTYLEEIASYKLQENQQYLEPGKWNISPNFKERKYPTIDWKDKGIKLLSLFRYWNIIEYFFPYKALMDKDWDNVLHEYIPKILDTDSELTYKLVLLELVCEIQDGHGGIHSDTLLNTYFGKNQIPIELKLIEGKAYVHRQFSEIASTTSLKVGDEIVEIGGKSLVKLIDQKQKYLPASTEAGLNRILAEYLLRTSKDEISIKIERDGQVFSFSIPTILYNTVRYVQKDIPSHQEFGQDIAYLYAGSIAQGELDTLLENYQHKKSIIFDYRSYPKVNIQNTLPHFLLPFPTYAFKSTRYSKRRLGDFNFSEPYPWGKRNEQYFKGNFIILVNEYTQSQPEFESLIYAQAPQVTIIGSSTAGTIGNWTPIYLPGNILTSISGNGIFRLDESPVQRIGIIPDIYVKSTLEGIKMGKDEILLKAIEFSNSR